MINSKNILQQQRWLPLLITIGFCLISQSAGAQLNAPLAPPPAPATPALQGSSSERSQAPLGLSRAKNLARQTAEIHNGGLQKYRAEDSMHGPSSDTPFSDQGTHWIFTFKGRAPGVSEPTTESTIQVEKDTFKTSVLANSSIGNRLAQ